MKIEKNDKIVTMLSASALGEKNADSIQQVNEFTADLMKNPTPENKYHMAELIRFAVQDGLEERFDYLNAIADNKTVGDADELLFDVNYANAYAVVQADNSTTPMWYPASKSVSLPTVEVASRFRVSMYDIRAGRADLPRLTRMAIAAMEGQVAGLVKNVLSSTAITGLGSPFYGTGSGVVLATLDPMVRHFQRYGAVNIVGDIAALDQLAEASKTAGWVSGDMKNEFFNNGFIGKYKGANAIQLTGGYEADGITPVNPDSELFILPNGYESPLKIGRKGDVLAIEETHGDTAYYEVSLRQRVGVGFIYGTVPMAGVYHIQ